MELPKVSSFLILSYTKKTIISNTHCIGIKIFTFINESKLKDEDINSNTFQWLIFGKELEIHTGEMNSSQINCTVQPWKNTSIISDLSKTEEKHDFKGFVKISVAHECLLYLNVANHRS